MTREETPSTGFDLVVAAVVRSPGVSVGPGRRGFGSGALQVGGRIFAMDRRGALVLKLPAARVAALVAKGLATPFDAGKGRPMREWVVVSREAEAQWLGLAKEALSFVAGHGGGTRRVPARRRPSAAEQ